MVGSFAEEVTRMSVGNSGNNGP